MPKSAAIVVALLLSAGSAEAWAQTLRGRAVQPSDSAGIAGVLVLLIDTTGGVAARALTNEHGAYRIAAPRAGAYRVRTLRIGYHPAIFDAVQLSVGADVERQLELTSLPLMLDTVRVPARARCSAYEGSSIIALAWEQARTAFAAADLTTRSGLLNATVTRARRALEPRSENVLQQSSTQSSGLVNKPWGTVPPDSLRHFGYVYRRADGGTTYYAPDIEALLSAHFVQDHCFRFASGPDTALIGMAFEPTRDRESIPEVAGTVWLDRKSAELRRMDFRYTNLKEPRGFVGPGAASARGAMDFARMKNGGWAISNWEIRIPILRQRVRPARTPYEDPVTETYVSALQVEMGTLALVTQGRDTLWHIK